MRSNNLGTFSGVEILFMLSDLSFSRTMKEARPIFWVRRYSMHAWPCSTVSTTKLFNAPQAVDTATSYLSGMVPRLPRRPCTKLHQHQMQQTCRRAHMESRYASLLA